MGVGEGAGLEYCTRWSEALEKMPSEQSPEGGRGIPKAHGQCSWCVQGTPRKPVLLGQRKQKGDETRELTGPNVGGPSRPCCCSVTKLCPTFCDPHGLRHASLPCPSLSPRVCSNSFMSIEWVIPTQPFHPLSSPSPPACNHSQHQGLFQWISTSHQVAKIL